MKNNFKFLYLLGLLVAILAIKACTYDEILPEPPPPPIEDTVSFSNDLMPIFNASCNFSPCHSSGGPPPDLTPANGYNALVNGGYIDVDNPQNSELYQWMAGNRAQPMPLSGPNAQYNALVLAWITQGAENN